jgi:hypothetical protein
MPQRKLLEEQSRSAVMKRTPQAFTPADDVDQAALVKRFENRPRTDTPDLLDLGATDWLPVGNYRERFERRRRQSLRPRGKLRPLYRFGVLGPGQYLPTSGNRHELDTVTIGVVVMPQLLERGLERLRFVGVRSYRAQSVGWDRSGAREERRFKQLR